MKVIFELDCVDGYPPIKYETLNAEHLSGNEFRIKNAPFFVSEVSYDDLVVAVETDNPEQFNFLFVQENSSYTSISILIFDDSIMDDVKQIFNGHNCIMEYGEFGIFHVFSVAIPESAPYFQLRQKLYRFEEREKISFAELALAHKEQY
jgi:hypothetical protein